MMNGPLATTGSRISAPERTRARTGRTLSSVAALERSDDDSHAIIPPGSATLARRAFERGSPGPMSLFFDQGYEDLKPRQFATGLRRHLLVHHSACGLAPDEPARAQPRAALANPSKI